MIPGKNGFLEQGFEIEEQPSRTYKMHLPQEVINGYGDEIAAIEQAIYKILNTERYEYIIYSRNYGVEFADLFGEPVTYVCPELERRIIEALTWDERITSVDGFSFDTEQKRIVKVSFVAHTIFGDIAAERAVNI